MTALRLTEDDTTAAKRAQLNDALAATYDLASAISRKLDNTLAELRREHDEGRIGEVVIERVSA